MYLFSIPFNSFSSCFYPENRYTGGGQLFGGLVPSQIFRPPSKRNLINQKKRATKNEIKPAKNRVKRGSIGSICKKFCNIVHENKHTQYFLYFKTKERKSKVKIVIGESGESNKKDSEKRLAKTKKT